MQEIRQFGWIYYIPDGDLPEFDNNKIGKWMYFFRDRQGFEFAREMCKLAVSSGIVREAKVADSVLEGVACFYTEADDLGTQKKIISFFIDHGMIRKTKAGKFYNISFKFDRQTDEGAYGEDFQAELKLADFIDLSTGKWIR